MSDFDARRQTSFAENRKSLLYCAAVACFGFQYGFDVTAVGSFQAMHGFLEIFGYPDPTLPGGYGISTTVQQLISSFLFLAGIVTTVTAGFYGRYLGRKAALQAGTVFCTVAIIVMITTTSVGGLYAGRIVLGLANGVFMSQTQLYLNEIAPPQFRGQMLGLYSIWISLSSLLGSIITNYTNPIMSRWSYQIPLLCLIPIPLVLSLAMLFFPESPRWLASQGKIEEAGVALRRLRGSAYPAALVQSEFDDLTAALKLEEASDDGKANWMELWRGTNRRRTLLVCMVCAMQPASGALFYIGYGTYFFSIARVGKPFQNAMILSAVGCAIMIISLKTVKMFGRRTILIVPSVICAISQLGGAVAWTVAPDTPNTGKVLVGMAVLFIIAYDIGVGVYSWAVAGEIPSQRLRSYTLGLGQGIAFLGGWLTLFTAPYFINPTALNWGAKYCWIWLVCNVVIAVFAFIFLPETKDRSLEEIDIMFERRVPTMKFKGYVCPKPEVVLAEDTGMSYNDSKLDGKEISQHDEIANLPRV